MIPVLAVFLPLAIAYATALQWCVDRWNAESGYFEHCWLVPPVAAFVIWQRRAVWRHAPRRPDLRGLWLLVPALCLHLAGALLMVDSWSAASLALAVPGAAWLALGRDRLRGLWPVLWLVLFCVPFPIYVEGRLAFVLKEFAVTGGALLGNLAGADVARQGDRLVPAGLDGSLYVADACSGLRSLLAMLTLAYCLAFFTGAASRARRVMLLLVAAPLAIAANVVRIAALCLMARWFGVPFAEGTGHTIANVVEWTALVLALVGVDASVGRRLAKPSELATMPSLDVPPRPSGAASSLRSVAIALWFVAVPLLVLSLWRPHGALRERAANLPATVGDHVLEPRAPEAEAEFQAQLPRWRELLGTDDFVFRRYRGPEGRVVQVVALFHDSNWKSVHPPRICIEGSNMDIQQDDLVPTPWDGGEAELSRIVAQSRDNGWRYVTLSMFGTADWASGDYWDFVLHHAPRALLRASQSGFLLRVEAPIYPDEPASAAEARGARFLRQLLPLAQELVR